MSENLDLVQSVCAAWERGDYNSIEWAHSDIDFVVADGPTPDSARGLAGMAAAYRRFLSAWESLRVEVDDYREIDDERVLVLTHLSGRGKTSGVDLAQMHTKQANLFHIRDGKVTRLVVYNFRDHVLADLGLEE
jgi:ketosteroid isomerase-like protein